jgi:hypothetical protein
LRSDSIQQMSPTVSAAAAIRELPLTGLSCAFPRQARWSLPFSSRQGYPAALLTGVLPTD